MTERRRGRNSLATKTGAALRTKQHRYSVELVQAVAKQLELGHSLHAAAVRAGVNRFTVYNWRDQYPECREVWEQAEDRYLATVEEKLARAIADGDFRAIKFFLESRHRSTYGRQIRLADQAEDAQVERVEIVRRYVQELPLSTIRELAPAVPALPTGTVDA